MRIRSVKALIASAVLGSALLPSVTEGDDRGFARISDRVQQTSLAEPAAVPPPEPLPVDGATVESATVQPIPESQPLTTVYDANGRPYTARKYSSALSVWFSTDPNACTLPPDYGFVPPTKMPAIEYYPVEYQRYWPNQWYGTPGMQYSQVQFPMVHMPTDTTQLGFTYQYVPHWRFNANMLPPAPNPEEWQRRACPQNPGYDTEFHGKIKMKKNKANAAYVEGDVIVEDVIVNE